MNLAAIRIGKSIDMLQGAVGSFRVKDTLVRLCLVIGKLSQALYLLVDHVVWANKLGLVGGDQKRLNRLAARFWLISILCGLVRNAYDIANIVQAELRKRRHAEQQKKSSAAHGVVSGFTRAPAESSPDDGRGSVGRFGIIRRIAADRPVVIDAIRNAADVFLPLATLEYVRTSDGFQGIAGMISSYMGILAVWDQSLKLVPS